MLSPQYALGPWLLTWWW